MNSVIVWMCGGLEQLCGALHLAHRGHLTGGCMASPSPSATPKFRLTAELHIFHKTLSEIPRSPFVENINIVGLYRVK